MRLNGWQRLWVFLSVPWLIGGLIGIGYGIRQMEGDTVAAGFAWGLGVPGLMYAFGWGVAWVRKGFKGQ